MKFLSRNCLNFKQSLWVMSAVWRVWVPSALWTVRLLLYSIWQSFLETYRGLLVHSMYCNICTLWQFTVYVSTYAIPISFKTFGLSLLQIWHYTFVLYSEAVLVKCVKQLFQNPTTLVILPFKSLGLGRCFIVFERSFLCLPWLFFVCLFVIRNTVKKL